MLCYLLDAVLNYCCFGRNEQRLVDKIKEDILMLSEKELNHIRAFIIKPLREKTHCC